MAITLNAEAVKVFAEIGYLGVSRSAFDEAAVIFDMLQSLRPGEEAGAIGAALAALGRGAPEKAVSALETAEKTPAVMAFLALAYGQFGAKDQAYELVHELAAMDAEADLVKIAREALSEAS